MAISVLILNHETSEIKPTSHRCSFIVFRWNDSEFHQLHLSGVGFGRGLCI